MTLLVLLDHDGNPDGAAMPEASREALTAGRQLADDMGADMVSVVIGGDDIDDLAEEAGKFGAESIRHVTHDLLADYGPDAWAESLRQLADDTDADAVMAVGNDRGNEVMAFLAARLDQPFVANCTAVTDADDDEWSMTRIQWGGSLLEDATLSADVKLISFGHHSVAAAPADDAGEADVEGFEVELDESHTITMIKDRTVQTQGVTLSTAPVVVSGGRGVGSADGFAPLEELAELLGGRVGCSRAVTNNGWRPHSDQVGQTGTRIAPEIYIATGISGAIQHWVGAMASKRILAINTDPEANMVTKADYAVIADLHKVVPAVSEEIRRRRQG